MMTVSEREKILEIHKLMNSAGVNGTINVTDGQAETVTLPADFVLQALSGGQDTRRLEWLADKLAECCADDETGPYCPRGRAEEVCIIPEFKDEMQIGDWCPGDGANKHCIKCWVDASADAIIAAQSAAPAPDAPAPLLPGESAADAFIRAQRGGK